MQKQLGVYNIAQLYSRSMLVFGHAVIMQYFLIIRLTSTKKFKKLIGHKHKFEIFLLVKSSVPENN